MIRERTRVVANSLWVCFSRLDSLRQFYDRFTIAPGIELIHIPSFSNSSGQIWDCDLIVGCYNGSETTILRTKLLFRANNPCSSGSTHGWLRIGEGGGGQQEQARLTWWKWSGRIEEEEEDIRRRWKLEKSGPVWVWDGQRGWPLYFLGFVIFLNLQSRDWGHRQCQPHQRN
jgi:hypothetical protein